MKFIVFAVTIVLVVSARAAEPDQGSRWRSAKINPAHSIELDKLVARYQRTVAPYQAVEKMKPNGVPAPVAFSLFYRECDNNFACSPAQGDPLRRPSVNVPKGRIPGKTPPFAWTDAAYDAYYVVDRLDETNWRDVQSALSKISGFNGTGYDRYHPDVPTPYLWSGTNLYRRGKYVSDGKFSANTIDQQVGVAAILLRLRERGVRLTF